MKKVKTVLYNKKQSSKHFLVILCLLALTPFQSNICMDELEGPLPSLPFELQAYMLAFCNRDIKQDDRIGELVKLREVCVCWFSILKDKCIADIAGLPTESWELSDKLAQAAKEEQIKTMTLLCKVYPWVQKQKALNVIMNNRQTIEPFDMLELLLNFGLSPSAHHIEYLPDDEVSVERDEYFHRISLLRSMILYRYNSENEQYITRSSWYFGPERQMFERLLEYEANTREGGLLRAATACRNLPAMRRLLACSLHPSVDYNNVCQELCRLVCCQFHLGIFKSEVLAELRELVRILIRLGADSGYEEFLDNISMNCSFSPIDPDYMARQEVPKLINRVKANEQELEEWLAQYDTSRRYNQAEYNEDLKKFWKLIDETDSAITYINLYTGQKIECWGPKLWLRIPRPNLDERLEKSQILQRPIKAVSLRRYLMPMGVVAALCYGLYQYLWYSDDGEDQEEDQNTVDTPEDIPVQEN